MFACLKEKKKKTKNRPRGENHPADRPDCTSGARPTAIQPRQQGLPAAGDEPAAIVRITLAASALASVDSGIRTPNFTGIQRADPKLRMATGQIILRRSRLNLESPRELPRQENAGCCRVRLCKPRPRVEGQPRYPGEHGQRGPSDSNSPLSSSAEHVCQRRRAIHQGWVAQILKKQTGGDRQTCFGRPHKQRPHARALHADAHARYVRMPKHSAFEQFFTNGLAVTIKDRCCHRSPEAFEKSPRNCAQDQGIEISNPPDTSGAKPLPSDRPGKSNSP